MARPKSAPVNRSVSPQPVGVRVYAVLFGLFLGLCFLKFPNPSLLEHLSTAPTNGWEWALVSWPTRYAYPLVGLLVLAGLFLMRWPVHLKWQFAILPLPWLVWVWISAAWSMDATISRATCVHFTVGVICFYLGLLVVGRMSRPEFLVAGMLVPFGLVLAVGWQQHFGGLAASREYFMTYVAPTRDIEPELLKRMQSDRIFATLFYPNSLAGLLLMVTPVVLGLVMAARTQFTPGARMVLVLALGGGAAACMVWSGSKTGWLLALAMGVMVMLRTTLSRKLKLGVAISLVVLGGLAFAVKYHGFFQRGATSVVARFDYWKAALGNVQDRPLTGSGPGTFVKVYQAVRPPEAEMARLVHNDYLQQFSDSGLLGGVFFVALVGMVVWVGVALARRGNGLVFGVVLGVTFFAIQSLVEFGFYVPATSWCWFGLSGWLVAQSGLEFDKPKAST